MYVAPHKQVESIQRPCHAWDQGRLWRQFRVSFNYLRQTQMMNVTATRIQTKRFRNNLPRMRTTSEACCPPHFTHSNWQKLFLASSNNNCVQQKINFSFVFSIYVTHMVQCSGIFGYCSSHHLTRFSVFKSFQIFHFHRKHNRNFNGQIT